MEKYNSYGKGFKSLDNEQRNPLSTMDYKESRKSQVVFRTNLHLLNKRRIDAKYGIKGSKAAKRGGYEIEREKCQDR